MKILGIESATMTASAAVFADGKLVVEMSTNYKRTHSESLMPMIAEVLRQAELTVKDLDAIAVSEGPGSFTGLRIGAATAKGLAYAAGIPIVPVPTLAGIAYGALPGPVGAIVCPLIDARRQEAYYSFFEAGEDGLRELQATGIRKVTEILTEAAALEKSSGKPVIFAGDAAGSLREIISSADGNFRVAWPHGAFPRGGSIAALGSALLQQGKTVSAMNFVPVYLQKSQAEQEREAKGLPLSE